MLRRVKQTVRKLQLALKKPPEFPFSYTDTDKQIVRQVRPYTLTGPRRVVHLADAVRYIASHNIPGAMLECGVWRGGSMMAVAQTLLDVGDRNRELYLFDTYEGMSEPTDKDVMHSDEAASDLLARADKNTTNPMWAYAPLDDVQNNLFSTGYPKEQLHFIKGKVEETLPENAPAQIALLRLDTDWYESTLHELTHLYPRLADYGVLIIDDYGWWKGARQAVDEYFDGLGYRPLFHRVDETAISCIKLPEAIHRGRA